MNTNETEQPKPRDRQKLFAALSLILGTAVALMFAEWGLDVYYQRLQYQAMDPGLIRYHAQRGWALSPGWSGQHTHYDYEATYNIGADGFRVQTASAADESAPRYAVLGDSFTFGLGVEDDQTFVSQLNADRAGTFRNLATPGTSTDQQLLLLRQVLPDASLTDILLVVYLPNDLLDNTLPYPLQAEQAKPYFQIADDGRLILANTPVPLVAKPAQLRSTTLSTLVLEGFDVEENNFGGSSLGRLVSSVTTNRRYDRDELNPVLERNLAPAVEISSALLDAIAQEAQQSGLRLSVVLLPGRDAMINTGGISHHFQDYLRLSLLSLLDDRGIDSIDLMTEMAGESEQTLLQMYFPNDGHLTPSGHRYVADKLAQSLSR